ncbi:hypothetical protein [Haloplanus halobius]|uniref:hypothetical protein n=1 Tax=Haloplanus halobius TaxID=2934938 RepID=UPI0020105C6B|nr:hypothetical protein [Haloplanus sp. XH21]
MTMGILAVTGTGLAAGIELFPSLAMSLFGLAVGGWLGEWQYEKNRASSGRDNVETA